MRLRIFLVAVLIVILLPVPALAAKFKPVRLAVIDTGISETAISKTNISDGTNPNDTITREQMAVMLYRYTAAFGYDLGKRTNLSKFSDVTGFNNDELE